MFSRLAGLPRLIGLTGTVQTAQEIQTNAKANITFNENTKAMRVTFSEISVKDATHPRELVRFFANGEIPRGGLELSVRSEDGKLTKFNIQAAQAPEQAAEEGTAIEFHLEFSEALETVAEWQRVCPYLIKDNSGQITKAIKTEYITVRECRDHMLQIYLTQADNKYKTKTEVAKDIAEALQAGGYNNLASNMSKEYDFTLKQRR